MGCREAYEPTIPRRTLLQIKRRTPENSGHISSTARTNLNLFEESKIRQYLFSKLTAAKETPWPRAIIQIKATHPKYSSSLKKFVELLKFVPPHWIKFEGYWESVQENLISERVFLKTWPTFQPLLEVDCEHINKYAFLRNNCIQAFTIIFKIHLKSRWAL